MAIYEIDFKDMHDRRIEIEAQTPEDAVAKFMPREKWSSWSLMNWME